MEEERMYLVKRDKARSNTSVLDSNGKEVFAADDDSLLAYDVYDGCGTRTVKVIRVGELRNDADLILALVQRRTISE
jgi:hypothetical protein